MNNPKLKQFLENFTSSEQNQGKMNDLVNLSFNALALMQKQVTATDANEQEKALEALVACTSELNAQFDAICESVGMSREEMQAIALDAQNFTPEQLAQMQTVRSSVETKAAQITANQQPAPKARVLKTQWIAG